MLSFNSLDYIFLIFSILILLGFITYEYQKSKNRNLISIFVTGSILVLVALQIVWIENQFLINGNGVVKHLHKFISIEGARTANFYFFISMITYLLGSWTSSFLKYKVKPIKSQDNYVISFSKFFYFFMFIIVITFIISLINLGGGIEKSLSTVGTNMNRGVTMHILFISLGKFPLFYKIINNSKINLVDILLFSFVIFATIFNARMNTALILLQFFLLWNYKIKQFSRKQ